MCFKEKLEEKHDSHLYLHYEKKPINTFLYFSSGLKKNFRHWLSALYTTFHGQEGVMWDFTTLVNWTQEDQCKGNFNVQFQKRVRGFHLGIQTQENWWEHEAAQATCFYCVGLFGNPDETQCTSLRNNFSVTPQE